METEQSRRESLPNRAKNECAMIVRKGENKHG